jgi:mRNA-degrading endonuclease YafQ of YafQ-DinJ toxin-antitoxin module
MEKNKITRTNKFLKQYRKLLKTNDFKEEDFIKVLEWLTYNEELPPKYKNHLLQPKIMRNMGMSYSTRYFIRIYFW